MNINVYDTYLRHDDGQTMHFDVLLPEGSDSQTAAAVAIKWLRGIGVTADVDSLQSCRFCHQQEVMPEVEKLIAHEGYAIVQMEGCPSPVNFM